VIYIIVYGDECAGMNFIQIDPRDTTRSSASVNYGNVMEKALSGRIHEFPCCDFAVDRDLNATVNIRRTRQKQPFEPVEMISPQLRDASIVRDSYKFRTDLCEAVRPLFAVLSF